MFNGAPFLDSRVGCDRSYRGLSTYSKYTAATEDCLPQPERWSGWCFFGQYAQSCFYFSKYDVLETGSVSAFRYKPPLPQLVPLEIGGLNLVIDIAFSKGII
jgi:hypothetical protein